MTETKKKLKINFSAPTSSGSTGSRKNAVDMIETAVETGVLDEANLSAETSKYADDRNGFEKLKAENKIPKCIVKNSTCSNEHFTVKLKNGKSAVICVTIGKLMQQLFSGKETISSLQKKYSKA